MQKFICKLTNDEIDIMDQFGERGKAETRDQLSAALPQIKDGDAKRIFLPEAMRQLPQAEGGQRRAEGAGKAEDGCNEQGK